MAIPQITVLCNLATVTGDVTTWPTTWRAAFTPNFVPVGQLVVYEDYLNSIEPAYGGFNAGGNM